VGVGVGVFVGAAELLLLLLLLRLLLLRLLLLLLLLLLELFPGTTTVTLPPHSVSVKPAQLVAVAQNGKKYLPAGAVSKSKPSASSNCVAVTINVRGLSAASISPFATVIALAPVVYILYVVFCRSA
jgi:hypothetical protein